MAVYTQVSDKELECFLESYDLGAVLAFKGIAEGVENTNFFLKTERSSFILTLYEKRVEEKDLPFFLNLMGHLSNQGLNCPSPILNKEGVALGYLAGRPAVIISFLEGISVKHPTALHCKALGQTLAQFHEMGKGFDGIRPNALSVDSWRPLLMASGDNVDTLANGLKKRLERELDFLEKNWPKNLPSGVIHADLFTDNVFFIDGKLSGVIDFYFACTDAFAYDLAICINAWCFEADGSYNHTKGCALLAGYQSVRSLTPKEIEIFSVLCRGSAIRFALTRLYDWLNVPEGALVRPKNPLEYDRKLAFHRQVTSPYEYGFL